MAECEPSLRESKRQATRAAIEDRATALAAERGFNNVTVDDICSEVGISKRTFFNYVDSKETAVLGAAPRKPSEEERAQFLATEHSDLLFSLSHLAYELTVTARFVAPEQRATIMARRRKIRQEDPQLAIQHQSGVHAVAHSLMELVQEYLELYPGRKVLSSSAHHEARTLISVALGTVQLGYFNWMEQSDSSNEALKNCCIQAMDDLHTIFQGRGK